MCLITLAYHSHPDYPLLVAANRDEYYRRPTAPAGFWEEAPQLLAGRDLEAGGTWMGVTRSGRFAAITNHRNPPGTPSAPRSRGLLTLDFLLGDAPAQDYLDRVAADGGNYAGFNLLLGDGDGLFYFSNIEGDARRLEPGIHSISNALLDSGWPKQMQAEQRLAALLDGPVDHAALRETVSGREPAAEEQLPDTGVGVELERTLSPQFIVTPEYGTRSTTSLWIDRRGEVELQEQNYLAGGLPAENSRWRFSLDAHE